MSSFRKIFELYNWDDIQTEIYQVTEQDVERVLAKDKIDLEDFKVLISPAAKPFLEEMARRSYAITKKRFGNTIQMYIPMYLSNECQNICTYCGFSLTNLIPRKTLSDQEILDEVAYIKKQGYDHILLVTGEANKTVGVEYLKNAIKLIREHFSNISIEVQPLNQEEYEVLIEEGLYAVLVYQETYHEAAYKMHHPKGKKSNFNYRLYTPDRLGKAGIHKIGLGALFGLEDWRVDSFYTALHLKYLQKTYWKTKYSISFPRLRPHEGDVQPKVEMTDSDLVQLICAYRLLDEDVELSISTRESEKFRNNIINLGITSMSAASKTNPGGYSVDEQSLEQFEISDERSTEEIKKMIQSQGYEVVWKDWEKCF
ncbi:2-iminoacetate synthase ThiH [Weeksellaceae bacterium KMM 9713]|uniref:2-iminoacetate synthase ThiH n=1 Tax=Profundicola chukchiensis TaxID=2961959 RepID=A0A9X4MY97_9FLAO|nr:2-iminoacetate synthase ThiH [Profundicola chukchiensis]MDG4946323.1 2-iminoacetate synthase ThiH [Profundicola chukchiensis]